MYKINGILKNSFFIVLALLIIVYIVNAFSHYFLWYDEAGQFYIAKGLCHYSAPYSSYSGLSDVIHYNRYFNMDPGGYSILLHYWTMISNSYQWMRFLSLFFFFSACLGIYKIGLMVFVNDKLYAIMLSSLFLIVSPFFFISDQIRAYSMEMFGVVLSLYYLLQIKDSLKAKQLLILSGILFVFMTSRYSFVIYSLSLSMYVIYLSIERLGIWKTICKLWLFLSIIFIGVLFVFFLAMHYQNSHADKLWYLDYLGSNVNLFYSWLSIRFYIVLIYVLWKLYNKTDVGTIPFITVIVSTFFFILSVFNMYPWDTQRVLPMTILQYLTISQMVVDLDFFKPQKIVKSVCLLAMSLLSIVTIYDYFSHPNKLPEEVAFEDFVSVMKSISPQDKIFINSMQPDIRYQFEEGIYKKMFSSKYPNNLIFAAGGSHALRELLVVGETNNPEESASKYFLFLEPQKVNSEHYTLLEPYNYMFIRKE